MINARDYLTKNVHKGMTVYYVTRKTTASGRKTNEFYIVKDGFTVRITRYLCELLGYKWVDGCFDTGGLQSMSHGSDIVCRLSEELFQGHNLLKWERL